MHRDPGGAIRGAVVLAALWVGCSPEVALYVDLRTDLRPGIEIGEAHVALFDRSASMDEPPRAEQRTVLEESDDLLDGARIAELTNLARGDYLVVAELMDPEGVEAVLAREAIISVERDLSVTLVLTRSCANIACPLAGDSPSATACLEGACIEPTCVPEQPASCPADGCATESDCPASAPECAAAACVDGVCLEVGDDAMCTAGRYCDPDQGCALRPDTTLTPIPIGAAGLFTDDTSELSVTLTRDVRRSRLTIATWFRSDATRIIPFGAGETTADHAFVWVGMEGRPFLQQHRMSGMNDINYGGGVHSDQPSILGRWTHLVVALDLSEPDPSERVRWWVDGERVPLSTGSEMFPMDLPDLYLGGPFRHTIGNKWNGGFDLIGELAETYIIWDEALDASYFVVGAGAEARSISYTGPVTPDSVYFDYVTPGDNRFDGQPDWAVVNVTSDTTDLPY